jgi:hypothetical protein
MKKNVPETKILPSKRGWDVLVNDVQHKSFKTYEKALEETVSIKGYFKLSSDIVGPEKNKK